MSLKSFVTSGIQAGSRFPLIATVLKRPAVRQRLQGLPGAHLLYPMGWDRQHPFDTANGTETSGFVPGKQLQLGPLGSKEMSIYAGSQPSIIRTALGELPPLEGFSFVDLGCGKGRPILVAAEFPFKEALGVEFDSGLAECGRRNLEIFRTRYPGCCPLRIETADATSFAFPAGDLVVFLYNPFGPDLIQRVVDNIERTLAASSRRLFVVYYNPVNARCFDASPRLRRYFAATVPYASNEMGFGPDAVDVVVIWQAGDALPAKPGADAKVVETKSNVRVKLEAP